MDIFLAVSGALSIYFGYRLFCHSRHWPTLIAGALLALLGVGMLVADVRKPLADHGRPDWQKRLKIDRKHAAQYPEFLV
jgi:putative Mn2+ efflux pump MntP